MQNWIRFDKLNKVGQMLNFNNASTKPLKSSIKSINEDSISSIIWLFHNVFVKYEGNHNLEKFFFIYITTIHSFVLLTAKMRYGEMGARSFFKLIQQASIIVRALAHNALLVKLNSTFVFRVGAFQFISFFGS